MSQVADIVTGLLKIRDKDAFSDKRLKTGLINKAADWVLVALAFVMVHVLILLGGSMGVDFGLSRTMGWMVLASMLYKEIRSIFDNLSALGIAIPPIFLRSLNLVKQEFDGELTLPDNEEEMQLKLNKTLPELNGKDVIQIRIKK